MKNDKREFDRQTNYDLLRIICAIAIITIHVSATYKTPITSMDNEGHVYSGTYIMIVVLYNTLSRFAVPCFLMLSGAFLLTNEKNRNYKYFYTKSFIKIGIPVIIFTVLYTAYEIFKKLWHDIDDWKSCISIMKASIVGRPFYHMWYVYMLIGVYLLVPMLIIFKGLLQKNHFLKLRGCF